MPKLVRFLAFHAGVGFALALVAVIAILGLNVANLGELIMTSSFKWIAILALVVLMTITLASVQMGVAIMCLPYEKDDDNDTGKGLREPQAAHMYATVPVRVKQREDDRPLRRRR